ncbi:MAG: hypothetical protein AB4368_15835 [Xenococcaceae cyanobacterium]
MSQAIMRADLTKYNQLYMQKNLLFAEKEKKSEFTNHLNLMKLSESKKP